MSKAYDFLESMNGSTPEEEKSGNKAYNYLKSINQEAEKPPEVVAEVKPVETEPQKPEADKPGFFKSLFSGRTTRDAAKVKEVTDKENQKKSEYEKSLVSMAQMRGVSFIDSLKPEDKDILITALKKEKNKNGIIRAATAQDLPAGDVEDPRNPENFLKYELNKDKFSGVSPEGKKLSSYASTAQDDAMENIGVALNMGRDQVFGTLGAIGEWAGVSDGTFRKQAEKSQEQESSRFNKPMDANDNNILDSRFWTQKVPQSIPFMIALAPSQVAGAGVGGAFAARLGFGSFGKFISQSGFAGLSSRFAEGMAEGGQTYAELKDSGVSDEVASSKAWKTTQANMALVFSDITQMAATFAPVKKIFPKIGSSTLGKFIVGGGKFVFDGASEGGEEVFQGYVQQYNMSKGKGEEPMSVRDYLGTDEAQNAFVLGATSGMMFGGIGVAKDVYDNFEKRTQAQVDMVEKAVEEDDINFIQGMKFLQEKDVISENTVKATENLIATMVQEKKGVNYEEWVDTITKTKEIEANKIAQKLESLKSEIKTPSIDQDKKEEYKGVVQDMIEVQGNKFFEKDGKIWKQPAIGQAIEGNKMEQTPEFRQALIEEGAIPEHKESSGTDINVSTKPTELESKPTDLTDTPQVAPISKMETPESVSTPENTETSKYQMEDISEKAFVVKGETMGIKEQLKEAGGKWNPKYKGWIFSKKRRDQVQSIIDEAKKDKKEDNTEKKPVKTERETLEERKKVLEDEQQKRIADGIRPTDEEWQKIKSEYGIIEEKLRPYAIQERIQKAVSEKDYEALVRSLSNMENRDSRKAFRDITGIKLGNQKETIQQVKEFVGEDQYSKYLEKVGAEKEELNLKLEKRRQEKIENEWKAKKIKDRETRKIMTQYDYYEGLLNDGWTWEKYGIGNVRMKKDDTFFQIREKGLIELLKLLSDRPATESITDAEFKALTGQDKTKEDNAIINNPTKNELNTGSVPEGGNGQSMGQPSKERASGQQGSSTLESQDGLGGEAATSNRGIGKKGRAAINEKAKAILESKDFSTDAAEYSQEELDTLKRYTGAGGKEDAGASGRGLLDEYYTPSEVVDNMWNLAIAENPRIKSVFEPTAGVGRFIQGRTEEYEISGMEIDKVSGTIAQIFNPGASIKVGDFQNLFITSSGKPVKNDTKYDLIIGNPPYGDRGGILKGLGEEGKIGKQEEYFIKRGIDMLNPGGVVSFIVPSSFLKNGKSYAKERIVAAGGELVNAYRLPEGIFEDTTIGTDIVVIKKTGNGSIGDFMNDSWFESHMDTIMGTIGTRKNRFGKQEEFVSGNKEETFKKLKEIVSNLKLSPEDTKVVEPLERMPEPTVAEEAPKRASTPRAASKVKTEKVVDVAGVRTTDKQVLNDWNSTPEEIEIFQNTNTDGTVEYRKEWSEYLNYYEGGYYHDINYFSGDIRDRLRRLELEKDKVSPVQYEKQKKGLEKVKPKDKGIQEISFDPLDRFVIEFPTGGTKEVLRERKWEMIPKTIRDGFGDYMIRVNRDLLGHGVQIGDVLRYVDGDRARADTKAITGYIRAEAKRFFNEYIKTALDYETQQKIAEKYNNEKNAYVRPQYDRIPVQVEGMAEEFRGRKFHLSETQKGGVGFLINKGSGMVAYGVGVGKTHTLIVATMANMQKGWTKRPLFIVPGSTLEKTWIQTIKATFPGVKINNLEGLQAPVVRRLIAERGEDYTKWIKDDEVSIITHDGILKLGFKNEELFELTRDMEDALGSFDREATDRNREKDREKIQEELGKALRGQSEISFTDLGFDHISVDEVHNFRKVFQGAKIEENKDGEQKTGKRFGNVIGGVPSTRARKLFLLSQAVQKKNKGRNVFLASATPFENHATEIYNILSFMARDRLKQMHIFNINDFFTTYANFQTENVMKADGNFENKDVMKSFANLSELQKLVQEFIDFKEDETLVRPDKKVLTPQLKMSPKQKEVQASIVNMLNSKDDGVVLKASTYAKSNAVSPFFVAEFMSGPTSLSDFIENSPKIQYTLEMVKELRKDPKTAERGNFIYIGKEGVSYTQYYIDYLTKDGTYKPSQIAVITGEISIEKREEIKDKFNSGEIKVLIGGDPTKEGIDLQQNGYATFIVSLGWNPTEMKQVEGRVWRQGNNASQVLMVYPLIENSGDIKIYQLMEEKGGRINDVFSYSEGSAVFDLGEIDPKEKKLMLLTDPVAKANLSILIDSDRINGELLYTKGQKEDLIKQQARYDTNIRTVKDLTARIEFTTDEERVKELKKEIKKAELDNTGISKKLEEKGITTIENEIAKLEVRIAKLEEEIAGVKLQFTTLLEKYTQEEIDNLKLTKTLENHREDIKKVNESLFYKSETDLAAEKAKKIEVNDAKIAAQRQQSRIEGNKWIYDIVGDSYKSYIGNERISIEDSYLEAMRLAPDGWRVEIRPAKEMGQSVAFADLEKKLIVLSETEVKKTTAAHEVVHASLSELPKDRQEVIIRLSKKQWRDKAGRDLTNEEAEEFLAEEFKYYVNKKKFKTKSILGKIKEFLISIKDKIFGKKTSPIQKFYEDILSGALNSKETAVAIRMERIREENKAYLDRFIEEKNQEGRVDEEAPPRLGPNYDLADEEEVQGQFWDSFKDSIQTGFEPLDTTLGNIDKDLKNRLIRFEQQVANSNIIQKSVPLIESLKEKLKGLRNTEEYKILDIALKNGDVVNIQYYSKKLGIEEEMKAAKELLELIYGDAIKVGIDVGYLEQYFPRTVKDSRGLLNYIYGTEFEGGIREAIAKEEAKLGGGAQLSEEEKAAIVNKMLRGYKVNGISLLGPGNVKARALEFVGKETNQFYEDSFDSLTYYIRGMNENIQARIFFGDIYSKEEQAFMKKARNIKRETERIDEKIRNTDNAKSVEKLLEQKKKIQEDLSIEQVKAFYDDMRAKGKQDYLASSISAWVLKLLADGKITPIQEMALTRALNARFKRGRMSNWMNTFKNISYLATMGSVVSTISQLGDLGWSIIYNGYLATGSDFYKSAIGTSRIKKQDVLPSDMFYEFQEGKGGLKDAVASVFRMVGLTKLIDMGSETLINGAYRTIQKRVLSGDLSDLAILPEESRDAAVEALKKDLVSDDIKAVLFGVMYKFAPIATSRLPALYNTSGNARIFYMLKSFLIVQIDVFRQDALKDMKEGTKKMANNQEGGYAQFKKGSRMLMKMAIALMLVNAGADILKNFLLNRPFDLSSIMVDNILKLAGFSKYTTYKIKEEGIVVGVASILLPPSNIFKDPISDVYDILAGDLTDPTKLQTINNIPIGGKLFYWWFGKGADKSEKKRNGQTPERTKSRGLQNL